MTSKSMTITQLKAYRFMARRLQCALIHRDIMILDDPFRTQSYALFIGCKITMILCVIALIISVLKPSPHLVGKKILVNQDTGALYVETTSGLYHPVMNLASAMLILGSRYRSPIKVSAMNLRTIHLGTLLGISGAPVSMNLSHDTQNSWWSICDEMRFQPKKSHSSWSAPRVTEIITQPDFALSMKILSPREALLVISPDRKIYLLYANKRLKLNLHNLALWTLFRNKQTKLEIRSISSALLNAIPEGHLLDLTRIKFMKNFMPSPQLGKLKSGQVILVQEISGTQSYYVVLNGGVQSITLFVAQLILANSPNGDLMRFNHSPGFINLPAARVIKIPRISPSEGLNIQDYPPEMPVLRSNSDRSDRFLCILWHKTDNQNESSFFLATGPRLPLPTRLLPIAITSALHDGKQADQVAIPPLSGEYVYSAGLETHADQPPSLFYISDTGIKYPIGNAQDAAALGLSHPQAIPGEFLVPLSNGPLLSRAHALAQPKLQ